MQYSGFMLYVSLHGIYLSQSTVAIHMTLCISVPLVAAAVSPVRNQIGIPIVACLFLTEDDMQLTEHSKHF